MTCTVLTLYEKVSLDLDSSIVRVSDDDGGSKRRVVRVGAHSVMYRATRTVLAFPVFPQS